MLVRPKLQERNSIQWPKNVEVSQGDLNDVDSLRNLLEPGCTVINLVYSSEADEQGNLAMMQNLLNACLSSGIARLIHCSTAVVSGRNSADQITEASECRPITEYGITKLKIEQTILDAAKGHLEAVILRPTAVFGPGGKQLNKLSTDLVHGSLWRNYLKTCLFGQRRMNLVYIDNVVAAILFLLRYAKPFKGSVFIVSDDAFPNNSFIDVERFLIRSYGLPDYPLPQISLPLVVLRLLLRALGKDNINPHCNYSQKKLEDIGFKRQTDFETGVSNYAGWFLMQQTKSSGAPAFFAKAELGSVRFQQRKIS